MKYEHIDIKTFSDLLDFIKSNKNFLKKVLIISLLLTSFYSFFAEVYYQSEITLYPAGELADSGEIFSDFSDLIETLGINSLSSENNFYIPDIIESRSLKKKIIYEKWNSEKFDKPVNLISYWKIDQKSFLGSVLSFVNNKFNSFKIDLDLQYEQEAIEKLDNLIYVDEKNSGLIQVVVLMEEPILAADIANYIAQYVVDYVGFEQKMFASKTKRYLEDRLLLSQSELRKSENILAEFRNVNPLSQDNPVQQLNRLRLIRDVDVNQEVYITIKKQLELAKIEESKERLFINVLDKAIPPIFKEYPKRFLIIISFSIISLFISIIFLLVSYRLRIFSLSQR
mgnify:CR=1 FL=1